MRENKKVNASVFRLEQREWSYLLSRRGALGVGSHQEHNPELQIATSALVYLPVTLASVVRVLLAPLRASGMRVA